MPEVWETLSSFFCFEIHFKAVVLANNKVSCSLITDLPNFPCGLRAHLGWSFHQVIQTEENNIMR